MKLLFVADLHGSTEVLRKAVDYTERCRAEVLVVGGDLSGKWVDAIVRSGSSLRWDDPVTGGRRSSPTEDGEHVLELFARVGGYGWVADAGHESRLEDVEFRDQTLRRLALDRLKEWIQLLGAFHKRTGTRVLVLPGNDDDLIFDEALRAAEDVLCCEERIIEIGRYQFAGLGWVLPTPWRTPRELDEAGLQAKLEAINALADPGLPLVLCAHCPPYNTGIDGAPLLDERIAQVFLAGTPQTTPVGSRAIRAFLERARAIPLSLHGHIHEAGGFARVGQTLCLNPGSEYERGTMLGHVVVLEGGTVASFKRVRS